MSPAAAKSPHPAFWEVLVEGHPERVQGLLTGLVLGSGSPARILFSDECGIKRPIGERVLEAVHLHGGISHLVVDSPGRQLLREHAKSLAAHGLHVVQERKVAGGRFRYRFHAYAPRYAEEIRELLDALPRELRHEAEEPRERIDPRAAGMEAYTPVHHYEIEGEGTVRGSRIDLLVDARRQLDDHPLVKADPIELEIR
jgi:hypothetical protein